MKNRYNFPNSRRATVIIRVLKAAALFAMASEVATGHPYVALITGGVAAACTEAITALSDKNDPESPI